MYLFVRLLIVAALAWVGVVLYMDAQKERESETPNNTKVVLLFGGVVLVGTLAGVVVGIAVVPAVGDAIGHFFFNPNERIEKDPHAKAVAKLAQGDTEGAIAEYIEVWRNNPHDTLALTEIVHLYCDKLRQPGPAVAILEEAIEHDLPPEEAGVIAGRLADVYWNYQHDAIRAKEILIQIVETMPETKFAANAQHKLIEIDRALAQEDPGFFHHA